jgi:Flp pilus assembly pilin Flp
MNIQGGTIVVIDAINRVFIAAMLATKREEGQTFVEYALISVFVAVAITGALTIFKGDIGTALTNIGLKLKGVAP